jgi:hypothetical protein
MLLATGFLGAVAFAGLIFLIQAEPEYTMEAGNFTVIWAPQLGIHGLFSALLSLLGGISGVLIIGTVLLMPIAAGREAKNRVGLRASISWCIWLGVIGLLAMPFTIVWPIHPNAGFALFLVWIVCLGVIHFYWREWLLL